jgi:PAS domain S-box-containing protein
MSEFPFLILPDQLENVIFLIGLDDEVVYANEASTSVLGFSKQELLKKPFSDFVVSMSELRDDAFDLHGNETLLKLSIKCADESILNFIFIKKEFKHQNKSCFLYQEYKTTKDKKLEAKYDLDNDEVLNTIPDLLFVLDKHRRIIEYHTSTESLLAIPPSEFLGKTTVECLPADVESIVEKALNEADAKGDASGYKYSMQMDGNTQWYELSVKLNRKKEEDRYIVVVRNITQTKEYELALAENEARFRSFIEQGEDGIVLMNESGKTILWNKGMEAITGVPREEVLEKPIWEVMFSMGSESRKSTPGVEEQLKNRILKLLKKEELQWIGQAMENEILTRSGKIRILSTTLFPVEYDDKYLLGGIHRDITEQKMAELALRENEEYIRTLYYDSPVPVLVLETITLKIFDLNNAAVKAFGYKSREELQSRHIFELIPEEPDYNLKNLINEKLSAMSEIYASSFECHFKSTEGKIWDATAHTFKLSIKEKDLVQLTLIDTTAQKKAMKALFESEARYRAVAENANAGIGIFDLNEHIVYANETMASMLGYKKEEIIGHSMLEFTLHDNFIVFKEKTKERKKGLTDQYETILLHRNGEQRFFSVSASPLFSATKELIGTVGVMIDITEKMAAEKKLLETSEQIQAILASMPDMIFIMDKNGYYINSFINKLLYPNIEFQPKNGQHISDVFEKNEELRIQKAIVDALDKKETVVVTFNYEISDSVMHLEARISPMGADKVVSVVRDTTTLITLESELIYNNNLLRMLTQLATRFINLPVSQIRAEMNHALGEIGVFAGVDRVYIFDYDWEKETMSNTYEWCAEGIGAELENLQAIPNSLFTDWVEAHKQGEMTYVPSVKDLNPDDFLRIILEPQGIQSLITIPLMQENSCLGYVGFDAVKSERNFSDSELSLLRIFSELLTNLKIKQQAENMLYQNRQTLERQNEQLLNLNERLRQQNEEILQKNKELDIERERALASDRLKTAFLNNVSHEVRTPLNGIAGFAQFLSEENISAEDREEFITALNTSVTRLTDTINDIMDVSLLMSGNMNIYPEEIFPRDLLQEVYKKHVYEAKVKNLIFKIQDDQPSESKSVISDYGMIKKIINEIVGNSVKYTVKGQVVFGVKLMNQHFEIFVKDTGIGISESAMPKIFEPFVQEDVSSTRTYEGSGLGLTIVKGLVDLLKGSIDVESDPENGTTFHVKIPDMRQKQIDNLPKEAKPGAESGIKKMSILIAEDEALNVLYVKRVFKNSDYQLYFAQNGQEAVDVVKQIPGINLVLMDIKMPVMDGLEATRIIKAFRPDLPVIAVTAYAANDDRHACMNAGCDEYVSKPFIADELIKLIEKYKT